ncbi:hypothetical protein J4P02_12610 [Pseudomonas sp. NFXW11]|uniref:hypothetical protein n=1 Tax=Pseudomonas sp. NFXW11 TaxID=2819531 RepID=UPI003CF2379B
MAVVNSLSVATAPAVTAGIDEIGARQVLFEALRGRAAEPVALSSQAAEAAREDRLAFWLSAQVHALHLDPPGTQRPVPPSPAHTCAASDRCRYCQQEFDLLHKRAALLVLGQSGLLEW